MTVGWATRESAEFPQAMTRVNGHPGLASDGSAGPGLVEAEMHVVGGLVPAAAHLQPDRHLDALTRLGFVTCIWTYAHAVPTALDASCCTR